MTKCTFTTTVVLSLVVASVATANYARIAGYTPMSNVSGFIAIGKSIEAVDAALSKVPRDWALALAEFEAKVAGGYSLSQICSPDVMAPAGGHELFKVFASYYGDLTYVNDFVVAALKGKGKFNLNEKARSELVMKGIVLQGVLMASMSHLHKAISLCSEGKLSKLDGAPHYVDQAWALYASSESKGPIKLAEKRAPQFGTETTPFTEAGSSKVNANLLNYFKQLQTSSQQGDCTNMRTLVLKSIGQMQVPVIQGMLREAWEVDPKKVDEHKGADGFIEVVEGWAFARAVLPAIASCSAEAAKKIKDNMDTIALGVTGPHLPEGNDAVRAAVESTYPCLGISCSDVNAMVNPFKTGQTLWQPCTDGAALPSTAASSREISATPSGATLSMLTAAIASLVFS